MEWDIKFVCIFKINKKLQRNVELVVKGFQFILPDPCFFTSFPGSGVTKGI